LSRGDIGRDTEPTPVGLLALTPLLVPFVFLPALNSLLERFGLMVSVIVYLVVVATVDPEPSGELVNER
jgi:hypothetical protein